MLKHLVTETDIELGGKRWRVDPIEGLNLDVLRNRRLGFSLSDIEHGDRTHQRRQRTGDGIVARAELQDARIWMGKAGD